MPEIDGAVLDAPLETPGLEPEPESNEPEGGEPQAPAAEGAPKEPSQAAPIASDPKQIHQGVRATIAEVRAKNPAVADEIKSAYYLKQDLAKEGFRSIADVRNFKQEVQELGGPEEIRQVKQDFETLRAPFTQWADGKPDFIEALAADNPANLVSLFPAYSDKAESLAPDAFASWFSGRSVADMDQFGLRQDIAWLQRIAGDNAEVKQIADKFQAYVQRLAGFASKPFAAPKNLAPANDQTQQQPAENTERIELFRTVNNQATVTEYNSELTKQIAGRQVTPAQKTAIAELVTSAMNRAETADDRKKIDRYYQSNDKAGYLQYKKSIRDRALPKAVESAVGVILGRKSGPKPNAAAAPKPVNGRVPAPAAQGIKQVNEQPAHNTVMWGRGGTDQAMVMKGLFKLRDGTTVQWRG